MSREKAPVRAVVDQDGEVWISSTDWLAVARMGRVVYLEANNRDAVAALEWIIEQTEFASIATRYNFEGATSGKHAYRSEDDGTVGGGTPGVRESDGRAEGRIGG